MDNDLEGLRLFRPQRMAPAPVAVHSWMRDQGRRPAAKAAIPFTRIAASPGASCSSSEPVNPLIAAPHVPPGHRPHEAQVARPPPPQQTPRQGATWMWGGLQALRADLAPVQHGASQTAPPSQQQPPEPHVWGLQRMLAGDRMVGKQPSMPTGTVPGGRQLPQQFASAAQQSQRNTQPQLTHATQQPLQLAQQPPSLQGSHPSALPAAAAVHAAAAAQPCTADEAGMRRFGKPRSPAARLDFDILPPQGSQAPGTSVQQHQIWQPGAAAAPVAVQHDQQHMAPQQAASRAPQSQRPLQQPQQQPHAQQSQRFQSGVFADDDDDEDDEATLPELLLLGGQHAGVAQQQGKGAQQGQGAVQPPPQQQAAMYGGCGLHHQAGQQIPGSMRQPGQLQAEQPLPQAPEHPALQLADCGSIGSVSSQQGQHAQRMPSRSPLRTVQARLTPSGGCRVPPPPTAAQRWAGLSGQPVTDASQQAKLAQKQAQAMAHSPAKGAPPGSTPTKAKQKTLSGGIATMQKGRGSKRKGTPVWLPVQTLGVAREDAAGSADSGAPAADGGDSSQPLGGNGAADASAAPPAPVTKQARISSKAALPEPEVLAFDKLILDAATTAGAAGFAVEHRLAAGCLLATVMADVQSGTQMFSSCRPLAKSQEQNINKLAGRKDGRPATAKRTGKDAVEGVDPLLGLAVMFFKGSAEAPDAGKRAKLFFLPLSGGDAAAISKAHLAKLLAGDKPTIAFDVQTVLAELLRSGLPAPDAAAVATRIIDPRLAAWLHEPHLVQKGEAARLERYGLLELCQHLGIASSTDNEATAAKPPLQRLRDDFLSAAQLAAATRRPIEEQGLEGVLRTELHVAAMLAEMEVHGMAFEPGVLQARAAALQQRCAAIEAEAAQLAGRPISLASPSQLSMALYTDLRLPPPPDRAGRPAAKTHLPTDEAALKHLQEHTSCRLPALVLEFRAMQNVLTKYVQPGWVLVAAREAAQAGSQTARVHCRWQQTSVATGRLSCVEPNLQAVTKYSLGDSDSGSTEPDCSLGAGELPALARINVRDAFVAPPGCLLLAADYSQVELRILAHLSGDSRLQQLLCTAGPAGDVFCAIAAAWLRNNACGPDAISKDERQRAKGVVYSVIYGRGAAGLGQQLRIPQHAAQQLISSFLRTFPQVKEFMESTKAAAHRSGEVRTMTGRRRPLKNIHSADRKELAEAERRAVNSIVQGSAADVVKCAMVAWSQHAAAAYSVPGAEPARLVAQIHDELLFEVPEAQLAPTASAVQRIMEGAAQLAVPLRVSLECGRRWGSMQPLQPA